MSLGVGEAFCQELCDAYKVQDSIGTKKKLSLAPFPAKKPQQNKNCGVQCELWKSLSKKVSPDVIWLLYLL